MSKTKKGKGAKPSQVKPPDPVVVPTTCGGTTAHESTPTLPVSAPEEPATGTPKTDKSSWDEWNTKVGVIGGVIGGIGGLLGLISFGLQMWDRYEQDLIAVTPTVGHTTSAEDHKVVLDIAVKNEGKKVVYLSEIGLRWKDIELDRDVTAKEEGFAKGNTVQPGDRRKIQMTISGPEFERLIKNAADLEVYVNIPQHEVLRSSLPTLLNAIQSEASEQRRSEHYKQVHDDRLYIDGEAQINREDIILPMMDRLPHRDFEFKSVTFVVRSEKPLVGGYNTTKSTLHKVWLHPQTTVAGERTFASKKANEFFGRTTPRDGKFNLQLKCIDPDNVGKVYNGDLCITCVEGGKTYEIIVLDCPLVPDRYN